MGFLARSFVLFIPSKSGLESLVAIHLGHELESCHGPVKNNQKIDKFLVWSICRLPVVVDFPRVVKFNVHDVVSRLVVTISIGAKHRLLIVKVLLPCLLVLHQVIVEDIELDLSFAMDRLLVTIM